jgi:hypothetical protein
MNRQCLSTIALFTLLSVLILGSLLTLFLSGCAGSVTGRAPETRTLTLPTSPAQAYTRATQVLTQMGAEMTFMDGRQTLQGLVHGAVVLRVQLDEHGAGTLVTVTGTIRPGKLILGTMTEVDQFCARITALEAAHAH